MGGIDLSEVYHNVVTVLRMKTGWATETLDFWNEYEIRFSPTVNTNILTLPGSFSGIERMKGPSRWLIVKIGSKSSRRHVGKGKGFQI